MAHFRRQGNEDRSADPRLHVQFSFSFLFFFRALELEANNDIKNKSGNAASIPVNTVAGSFDCNSVRFSPEKRAISHDLS